MKSVSFESKSLIGLMIQVEKYVLQTLGGFYESINMYYKDNTHTAIITWREN